MLKFVKGDDVKLIDPESSLIPLLEKDGWKEDKPKKKAKKNDDSE